MNHRRFVSVLLLGMMMAFSSGSRGESSSGPSDVSDWPMWRHDASRSGSTPHVLPNKLSLQWTRQLPESRQAWPKTQERLQFDVAPQPVVSGKRIFVPSNGEDSLTAYNTETGKELWKFFADAPIRFAPVAWKNKVYVVSDDSCLYCLSAVDGKRQWIYRGAPKDLRLIGNRRLISMWSARGGPVLSGNTVYFSAGIWPFMGVLFCAVDADTGKAVWVNSGSTVTAPQGHLVMSGKNLIVPGGRGVPAVLDPKTGKIKYRIILYKGGRSGASHVIAGPDSFYMQGFKAFFSEDGMFHNDPIPDVIDQNVFMFARNAGAGGRRRKHEPAGPPKTTIEVRSGSGKRVGNVGATKRRKGSTLTFERKTLCKATFNGDLGRIHLKAGNTIYLAKDKEIRAFNLPLKDGQAPSWSGSVDGAVWSMLAADSKLFVVTTDSKLYCFGAGATSLAHHKPVATALAKTSSTIPAEILKDRSAGYGLVLGLGDGRMAKELLDRTGLHLIVVDPDAGKIDSFRREMAGAGLYGNRIAAHTGNPATFGFPPYLAHLAVVPVPRTDGAFVKNAFRTLRPYGGTLLSTLSKTDHTRFVKSVEALNEKQAVVGRSGRFSVLTRRGALPGSGAWSQQHGSAAQDRNSKDSLVKLPLGVLWFGGSSHADILPRHGHGPAPQIAGGRILIEGPNMLRAMDVYTGRVLWEKELSKIGEPFDTSAHFAGAGEFGGNYVSLEDRIYVVHGSSILELDSATGKTLRETKEPAGKNWGRIGVWKDYLVTTSHVLPLGRHAIGRGAGEKIEKAKKTGKPMREVFANSLTKILAGDYAASSRVLHVFDRHTGKELWKREARISFRHNNIAVGAGKIFCVDNMSEGRRNWYEVKKGLIPTLYALDIKSGREIWKSQKDLFGTFLSYSNKHDVVVEGNHRNSNAAFDEDGSGIRTYQGRDGKILWYVKGSKHVPVNGPAVLWQDRIICGQREGSAFEILTGKKLDWTWHSTKGCGYHIASEHLMIYRSGSAAVNDLTGGSGTWELKGFRAGCTDNVIAADGVLNAPDYTRGCKCTTPNQTSLAMVHMPNLDCWTWPSNPNRQKGRIGLNFATTNEWTSEEGTYWVGEIKNSTVFTPEKPETFRNLALLIKDGELPWVAASGFQGLRSLEVNVPEVSDYQVRLIFLEPENKKPGERVFDVSIQGKQVEKGLDVVKEAGGRMRTLVKEYTVKPEVSRRGTKYQRNKIRLDFSFSEGNEAVISGIELIKK